MSPEIQMLKDAAQENWGPDSCSRQLTWYGEKDTPQKANPEKEDAKSEASLAPTVTDLGPLWIPDPFEWIKTGDGTFSKKLKGEYAVQYYGKDGAALPMYLEELAEYLAKKGCKARDDVYTFYNNMVWDDGYFQCLLAQAYHHACFDEFVQWTFDFYELAQGEWWFGNENGDQLEDMIDFTHYMLADYRVKKGLDQPVDPIDPTGSPPKETETYDAYDKNKVNAQELDKIPETEETKPVPMDTDADAAPKPEQPPMPDQPVVPSHRVRSKGPGNVKTMDAPKASGWGVAWSPLTRKGYLDFLDYCSGHVPPPVLENDQPLQTSMTSTRTNLHEQNRGQSIKWQLIKPGETAFLKDRFFRHQVIEPKDMTLQQLIDYCKWTDFETQKDVPVDTPANVKATIFAIGSMWLTYGTDEPTEVRSWLDKQCLDLEFENRLNSIVIHYTAFSYLQHIFFTAFVWANVTKCV